MISQMFKINKDNSLSINFHLKNEHNKETLINIFSLYC